GAITVVDPLYKLKQTAQGSKCIAWLHAAFGMYRQVSQLDDEGQFPPGVVVHRKAEGRLVDEGLQIVLVGHFHGLVRRIDPLHRQLQRLPAAHCAHGRGRSIDFLSFHTRRSKEGILGFLQEKREVGHDRSPASLVCTSVWICLHTPSKCESTSRFEKRSTFKRYFNRAALRSAS